MNVAVPTVLAASLLGSLHCAAMCGGLVAATTGMRGGAPAHAAYNLGRLAAYAVLGALAGGLGRAFALAGVGQGAALLSGALLVAWGAHALLAALGRVRPLHAPAALSRAFGSALLRTRSFPAWTRAGAVGLLSALLPCGWLWAFTATAAGTGSALAGATVMAVFWLGTLPVLVSLGAAASRFAGPLRRRLPVLTAAVVLALGFLVAWRGAAPLVTSTAPACCHVR